MKLRLVILWLLLTILACQPAAFGQRPAASKIAKANNEFALGLYAHLDKRPGNLFFSPISVDTALAMAYAGARGETARQMANVLHLPVVADDIHTDFGALLRVLNNTDSSGSSIVLANSLWAQQGYPFLEPFQRLLQDQYGATLNQIDLTGWPSFDPAKAAAARQQINAWAANQTRGKIPEIIPPEIPSVNTRLILVNAVWFKARWLMPFDKALTKPALFHLASGETVSVPTMHARGRLACAEADGIQVLELPYASNWLSMVIFLPRASDGLAEFEKTLTASLIEHLCPPRRPKEVSVSLPRFRCLSEFRLEDPLQQMGMRNAFSFAADFSGITKVKPFLIEAVIHKAYVDMDEAGTEAAAATAVPLMDKEELPAAFNADHAFLFLIRHNPSGTILFLGRVIDPRGQGGV